MQDYSPRIEHDICWTEHKRNRYHLWRKPYLGERQHEEAEDAMEDIQYQPGDEYMKETSDFDTTKVFASTTTM